MERLENSNRGNRYIYTNCCRRFCLLTKNNVGKRKRYTSLLLFLKVPEYESMKGCCAVSQFLCCSVSQFLSLDKDIKMAVSSDEFNKSNTR